MTRPQLAHDVRIIDTTLRDGSHAMAHQFTDRAGARHRAGARRGGRRGHRGFPRRRPRRQLVQLRLLRHREMELLKAAARRSSRAKLAVLLLPGIGTREDLKRGARRGCGLARIATHCTEADVSAAAHRAGARDGHGDDRLPDDGALISPQELAFQARLMETPAPTASTSPTRRARCSSTASVRAFEALVAESATRPGSASTATRTSSFGVANSVIAHEVGAATSTGRSAPWARARATRRTEVLAAVFDRLGVDTGLDVMGLLDAAEDVVRPYMNRRPKMDRNAIVQGWAGVYSWFLLHAEAAAERYKVPAHAILRRCGEIGLSAARKT